MGRRAAIGVDDDLAAGQSGIAVRTPDDEATGRVDVEILFRAHPAFRQDRKHMRTDDFTDVVLV